MNKYSPILKKMIDFTNIKLIVLANSLDYDISYISKWCNASKLPSQKYVRVINKKISEVLSKDIFGQNKVIDFFLEFDIKLPEDTSSIEDVKCLQEKIYEILMKNYKDSVNNYDNGDNNTRLVIGNSNIELFLRDVIQKQSIKSVDGFSDLLITMSLTSDGAERLLNMIGDSYNLNIKIGLPMEDFINSSEESVKKIYKILNNRSNLNITIYKNDEFRYFNTIVAKNNFVINYSLDKNKRMEIVSYSSNEEDVDKVYKILSSKFNDENILLKNVDSTSINKSGYRTDFYSDDYFNIFSCCGFEFLLPSNIITDIAKKEYEINQIVENMLHIKKLQIEWEEIFHNRKINFFVSKSALYKYIQSGKIVYVDTEYSMSIEERKEHFRNAMTLMNKNPNIKMYIIDDEKIGSEFKEFNLGIYLNQKKFFVKNYSRFFAGVEPFVYTAIDKELVDGANKFLERLKTSDYCREYSIEKLEEKWKSYGSMFLKIMEISEDIVG